MIIYVKDSLLNSFIIILVYMKLYWVYVLGSFCFYLLESEVKLKICVENVWNYFGVGMCRVFGFFVFLEVILF